MGVYIKGMEMPKDCLHCSFVSGCSYCEGYNDHCAFEPDDIETDWDFDHGVFPESIPDWCPLVPVPEHGKLIEKSAVFELIRSFPNVDRQLPVDFMKALYNLPTIIPAEEATP